LKKKGIGAYWLIPLAGLSGAYFMIALILSGRMMPGDRVNGYDVSLRSRSALNGILNEYRGGEHQLLIRDIHGRDFTLKGSEIDFRVDYPISELPKRNSLLFPKFLLTKESFSLEPEIHYDEEKLAGILEREFLSSESEGTRPRNAFLTDYIPGAGFRVAPEQDGDILDPGALKEAVRKALLELSPELDLSEASCYQKPEIRKDDPGLQAEAKEKNDKLKSSITYDFGNQRLTLNADTYFSWMTPGKNGSTQFDPAKIKEYVAELKRRTDTSGSNRSFRTATGQLIALGGPYGYNINQKKEQEQLAADLLSGKELTREPIYTTVGVSRSGPDYGNSYVEVDLGNQHVYLFEDGKVSFETDCVSGNMSLGRGTPAGIYPLSYKTTNATLKGPDYEAKVSYWMPFNRGIGLHDAKWRGKFGGKIYQHAGSHGCINLPFAAAQAIYQKVQQGEAIICHY